MQAKPMQLEVALDFADNPRANHSLCSPADTNGELYRALKVLAEAYRKASQAQNPRNQHPDDAAVDRFADKMKAKLAIARAKGRGGWDGDEPDMQQRLSEMLREHVAKGDPLDVANFAMFLNQRGEAILPARNTRRDDAYPFESALAELIEAVDPSLDSGDILADARAAATTARAKQQPPDGLPAYATR